jgi:membrane-bound lytic murein transglycosylase F
MVDLSPRAHRMHVAIGLLVAAATFAALVLIPYWMRPPLSQLEDIQKKGILKVLTLNGESTYYEGIEGSDGLEYQLVTQFAQSIGVKPKFIVVDEFIDIYTELLYESADLAAAGLSDHDVIVNPNIIYGPSYFEAKQQLLYRKNDNKAPKSLDEFPKPSTLDVKLGTSHHRYLIDHADQLPGLITRVNNRVATEELIERVENGSIEYLMADSHEIALQRRFYPELRVAFDVGEPKQLRWALKKKGDDSLLQALQGFFEQIAADGRLEQLAHRYYGHVEEFNYADLRTFSRMVRERLPRYRELFQREARANDMDWRLLAAIGYQESLWNPKAKSPTGVRGIMMLTQATAKHIGINNRLDPAESIRGGAIYFQRVMKKIPERIQHPDRTWLALASYNVGFGHLEDARKITQGRGGDPDKWIDVKQSLPLLSQKKWYKDTKHGYARGSEPVQYVENIRKYYDMLVWEDEKRQGRPPKDKTAPRREILISPSL